MSPNQPERIEPEQAERVVELFQALLSLDVKERPDFLASISQDAIRLEVESLLAAQEQAEAENFIAVPPVNAICHLVAEEHGQALLGRKLDDHYLLLSLLGAGGMGEVYLAHDLRLGRKVAIKLLPAEFTANNERVRRFEREARTASSLNHPNIITVHDIGRSDELYFIVTEYIVGQTLRQQIAETPMQLAEILEVAIQVASALQAAHEAGIAHRDIKPENIMLRRDGYVKVLDFGLAKLVEPASFERTTVSHSEALTKEQLATAPGRVMGTPHYMSPEQIRGQEVDGRSDIFSLGIVLYEMAARRRPFEGASVPDVIVAILDREAQPLASCLRDVPAEFERVVRKAIAKDRTTRYQTVGDLLVDLKELQRRLEDGERLPTALLPTIAPLPPPAPRKWSLLSLLLLALTVGLAADIARRFLGGGPELPSVLLTLGLGVLCFLAAAASLGLSLRPKWPGPLRLLLPFIILLLIGGGYFFLPRGARFYNERAFRLKSAGDLPAAIKSFARATRLDADFAAAHYNLGGTYEDVMEFEAAMSEYLIALRIDPKFYFAYNNLARLYLVRQKDYTSALNILNAALAMQPQEPSVRYSLYKNRGWAHFGLGLYDLAAEDLHAALDLRADGASAHCLLAQVLEGQKKEARSAWENCLAYAPGEPDLEALWLSLAQERLRREKN